MNYIRITEHIDGIHSSEVQSETFSRIIKSSHPKISVTDLINPVRGYYRIVYRVPAHEDSSAQHEGKMVHASIEQFFSMREVVTGRDGIKGIMDGYMECPVEIKSFQSLDDSKLAVYKEQLGFYCAMTHSSMGILILVDRNTGSIRTLSVRYRDIEGVWKEALRRKEMLKNAIDSRDPSSLPRCRFSSDSCEFRSICGCNARKPIQWNIEEETEEIKWQPEKRISIPLNAMFFPLKWYFQMLSADNTGETVYVEKETTKPSSSSEYEIRSMISNDINGAILHVHEKLMLTMHLYKNIPVEVKAIDRSWNSKKILDVSSYKIAMLAVKAAYSMSEKGYLVIVSNNEVINVYEFSFKNLQELKEAADRFAKDMIDAYKSREPANIPACPAWACRTCIYYARCRSMPGRNG